MWCNFFRFSGSNLVSKNIMPTFLIYILIGGGLGAALGYFGKCQSGGCPLTANWRRGMAYGAVLASVVYFVSGRAEDAPEMNLSTANVKHIAESEFEAEVLQSAQPVVVDFYATWCAPCRRLAPTVDAVAGQYAGRIKFVKVNLDEAPKLAQQFQVEGIPLLLFFKAGQPVGSSVGLMTQSDLAARVEAMLSTPAQSGGPAH
jgi:thioredoxin 1